MNATRTVATAAVAAEKLLPPLRLQRGDAARAPLRIKAFRLLARAIFATVFRVRIIGGHNVPPRNAIICVNHLGWTEGFVTMLYLPVEPRIYALGERPAAFLRPWYNRMLNWLEIFVPLDRDSPRGALLAMEDVIRRGGSLALAPEGHMGFQEGTIQPLQPGAAYISQRTGAPLLPIGLTGALELWLRCTLKVRIGRPIYPGEFTGSLRERADAMTASLEREMRALLPGDVDRPRWKPLARRLTRLF
jgi:1-acyl-sn-glycerol-3-phosphate acyltransferase